MALIAEALRDSAVFNFAGAVTMIVDDSRFSLALTANALSGFGIRTRHACHSAAEAIRILNERTVDLLFVDCEMPDMDGYQLVRWLRRSGLEPNAYVPVVMTAGHVRRARVAESRDCGANFLITKPFSAAMLLERVLWVARDTRPFLQVGDYLGPDRRFKTDPYDGHERRADMIRKARFEAEQNEVDQPA